MSEGWAAYMDACKSWLPLVFELGEQPRFQNPIRTAWKSFVEAAFRLEQPEVLLVAPVVRSLKLYVALIGGRRPLLESEG